MQNTAILSAPPAAPAQPSTAADNSSEQPAESFDSILARQLADQPQFAETSAPGTSLPNTKTAGDVLIIGASSENTGELQAPTPDGISTLPKDMLAALLPQSVTTQMSANHGQAAMMATARGQAQPAVPNNKMPLADALAGSGGATSALAALASAPATAGSAGMNNAFAAALEALKENGAAKSIMPAQTSAPQPNPTAPAAIQAQAINTAIPSAPIQMVINTPLNHEAWSDEFSQKITWVATQHNQSAELHLNPPQLGPLDVVIKVSGDQATALFTSPHAAVRDAIEQALPKLREMLADSGIMLGNATVSDQPPGEQRASQSGKQPENGEWMKEGGNVSATGIKDSGIAGTGRHKGMVDTFA